MSHRKWRRVGWLLLVLVLTVVVPCILVAASQDGVSAQHGFDALQNIPTVSPVTIRPRLFASYGALIVAAMLVVLYLYRGRPFVVYWIGGWLLLAASLAAVARGYPDPTLRSVVQGVSLLLAVWSAGLITLATFAFPDHALRWTWPVRVSQITAVWFLAAPFLVPLQAIVFSGAIATAGMLGWAASRYLRLARRGRYAGAAMAGIGLGTIGVVNIVGVSAAMYSASAQSALNQLAVVNVVVTMFVAVGMHLLVFEDMTQELRRTNLDLEAANERIRRLAVTDPLTGCHNRRFFEEIERREMQRHRRYGTPLSVIFVDVNHFKRLNDTLGHERGDDVLRAIGAVLRRHVRESDYVIRWGGDEFLLVLACRERDARAKAADLKLAIERAQEIAGMRLPARVTLSIGVAAVSKDAESLNDAIREADTRMYQEKWARRASL